MCNVKAQADFPLEYSTTVFRLYGWICGESKRINWKLKEIAGEFSKINGCKVNIKSSFPVFKKPVRSHIKMNENIPFSVELK